MNKGRSVAAAAVYDDKFYVVGGINNDSGRVDLKSLEVYDPTTEKWTTKADMPTQRHALAFVTIGAKIYAVGGNTDDTLDGETGILEAYDPILDKWQTGLPAMPTARWAVAAAAVRGLLFVVGGQNGSNSLEKVEVYDPSTNQWLSTNPYTGTAWAPLLDTVSSSAAAELDGKLYLVAGFHYDPNGALKTLQVYDPVTNKWERRASISVERANHGAVALDGRIFAIGGSGPLNSIEVYEPATDKWTLVSTSPEPTHRDGGVWGVLDDKIFAASGYVGKPAYSTQAEVYRYAPAPSVPPVAKAGQGVLVPVAKVAQP